MLNSSKLPLIPAEAGIQSRRKATDLSAFHLAITNFSLLKLVCPSTPYYNWVPASAGMSGLVGTEVK